jgi:hypothetical protein
VEKQKKTEPVFDFIINTSCEHMFPMRRFRELNKNLSGNLIYVLQSTNEINMRTISIALSGPEELAEQAELIDIMYTVEQRFGQWYEQIYGDR